MSQQNHLLQTSAEWRSTPAQSSRTMPNYVSTKQHKRSKGHQLDLFTHYTSSLTHSDAHARPHPDTDNKRKDHAFTSNTNTNTNNKDNHTENKTEWSSELTAVSQLQISPHYERLNEPTTPKSYKLKYPYHPYAKKMKILCLKSEFSLSIQ